MPRGILIVLAVALALRLLVIAGTRDFGPTGDPAHYDEIATWIAEAGRFAPTQLAEPGSPSAFRPPGYPLFLAGVYEVFGVSRYTVARGVSALLGVAFVLLVYLLVARVFDRRLALWSAGIAAVAPVFVWLNGSLLSESLFLPVAFAAALCIALFRERERWWLAALAGVLIGVAASTRTNGITLLLPAALGLARGPGLRKLAGPAIALVCTALVLVPWTVRNASVFDRFLPLGTQGGYTMAGQWNPQAGAPGDFHASWVLPETLPEFEPYFRSPGIDEAELDVRLRRTARAYAKDHPGHVVDAVVRNTLKSFDIGPGRAHAARTSYAEMGVPKGQNWTLSASIYALSLLALAGIAIALARRRRGPLWLWLMPVLFHLSGVLWLGNPRHTMSIFAFLVIPAAYALAAIFAAARRYRLGD